MFHFTVRDCGGFAPVSRGWSWNKLIEEYEVRVFLDPFGWSLDAKGAYVVGDGKIQGEGHLM